MSKKALIVEDQEWRHKYWKRDLGDKIAVISVFSIEMAEKEFAANPDLDVIVMDACVPGDDPTTPPLVRKLRETFTGPMIAISGNPFFRKILMQAGCNHECIDKDKLPQKICEVLGLT